MYDTRVWQANNVLLWRSTPPLSETSPKIYCQPFRFGSHGLHVESYHYIILCVYVNDNSSARLYKFVHYVRNSGETLNFTDIFSVDERFRMPF